MQEWLIFSPYFGLFVHCFLGLIEDATGTSRKTLKICGFCSVLVRIVDLDLYS